MITDFDNVLQLGQRFGRKLINQDYYGGFTFNAPVKRLTYRTEHGLLYINFNKKGNLV